MATHQTTQTGSVPGGILLITGCCIGAGMLGLPVLSSVAGFKPSVVMFIISWLFMSCTALLLLEVNLWFDEEVSLVSMADRTLGIFGKVVAWICFLFLFYALGVAYIAGSGELISDFTLDLIGINIPKWGGSLALCIFFAIFLYLGTRAVDLFNRLLMLGLAIAYVLLVFIGIPHVNSEYLQYRQWSLAPFVLPVMMISFGFHNLIPSLTAYLKRDRKRLRITVLIGSSLPLLIYIIWEWLILGLVPMEGERGFLHALKQGDMATHVLRSATNSVWIIDVAQYFAFFAILTSFLGNSLSFVHFLSDGFKIKRTPMAKIFLCALVIVPPFIFALDFPRVFLSALNYAGAYGAMTLFGLLPVGMVWAGRYYRNQKGDHLVPGGKATLIVISLLALTVMLLQITQTGN